METLKRFFKCSLDAQLGSPEIKHDWPGNSHEMELLTCECHCIPWYIHVECSIAIRAITRHHLRHRHPRPQPSRAMCMVRLSYNSLYTNHMIQPSTLTCHSLYPHLLVVCHSRGQLMRRVRLLQELCCTAPLPQPGGKIHGLMARSLVQWESPDLKQEDCFG